VCLYSGCNLTLDFFLSSSSAIGNKLSVNKHLNYITSISLPFNVCACAPQITQPAMMSPRSQSFDLKISCSCVWELLGRKLGKSPVNWEGFMYWGMMEMFCFALFLFGFRTHADGSLRVCHHSTTCTQSCGREQAIIMAAGLQRLMFYKISSYPHVLLLASSHFKFFQLAISTLDVNAITYTTQSL